MDRIKHILRVNIHAAPVLIMIMFSTGVITAQPTDPPEEQPTGNLANQPESWDMDLFREDLADKYRNKKLPITQSDFPVPHYNNKGTGYRIGKHKTSDIEFTSIGCWVGSDMEGKQEGEDVFFLLAVQEGKYTAAEMISRNHPTYVGQGSFKASNGKLDWIAINDGEGQSCALVNMRYFNLALGKLIIVFPLADKSLRFLQVPIPEYVSSKHLNKVVGTYLKREVVTDYLDEIKK